MTNVDTLAEGLVDQFFATGQAATAQAQRWTQTGELDRLTVSQLRLWAANRALDALARPTGAGPARATALRERDALIGWLEAHGYRALA
ncbi:hypothetical protein [Streptomyces gilvifuscus]|uniref:Uncharacterized protein n=1 Tax=Streptomyces gilvifuscus TaxID=1550617 RepID=A0ABT5G6T5_9ACTN|nr:hypothetical protein [Streptomyces gilvifuscus]MDC2960312.1 hypothetical protein [Streptomyces gilvifuscus]